MRKNEWIKHRYLIFLFDFFFIYLFVLFCSVCSAFSCSESFFCNAIILFDFHQKKNKNDEEEREKRNHKSWKISGYWMRTMAEEIQSVKHQTVHFVICSSLKTSHTCFDLKHIRPVYCDVEEKCVEISQWFFCKHFLLLLKFSTFSSLSPSLFLPLLGCHILRHKILVNLICSCARCKQNKNAHTYTHFEWNKEEEKNNTEVSSMANGKICRKKTLRKMHHNVFFGFHFFAAAAAVATALVQKFFGHVFGEQWYKTEIFSEWKKSLVFTGVGLAFIRVADKFSETFSSIAFIWKTKPLAILFYAHKTKTKPKRFNFPFFIPFFFVGK